MTSILVIIILLLVLAGGFFAACETVVVSASRARLHQRTESRDSAAARAVRLLKRMEMVLGTTLVGTNLMMVSATTLASWLIAGMLARHGLGGEWEHLLNLVVMTPLVLIVAELTPKAIGRLHADSLITLAAPVLAFFQILFYPVVAGAGWFGSRCARLLSGGRAEGSGRITREDLQATALAAAEHGIVEAEAGAMIGTVFELERRPLSAVMVPLIDVVALSEEASVAELAAAASRFGVTRFPVYRGRIDEIIGLVSLRQVLYGIGELWEAESEQALQRPIKPFVDYDVLMVPEFKSAASLLYELRYRPQPMAIVVDEHGGVVGIATTEDLVEELVGEIRDERDQEQDGLVRVAESVYDCDGKTEIRVLNAALGTEFESRDFETVAGLVLKLAGRIPGTGECFRFDGFEIEVLQTTGRRIVKLRFRRLPEPAAERDRGG